MAGFFDDKWVKLVALTTTILAVLAGISSLKGGGYSTKVQLSMTAESNKWAYFQAKSIKQHSYEIQRDTFDLEALKENNGVAKAYIDKKRKEYAANIERYNQEKNQIKSEAEALGKEQDIAKRHGGNFGMAVMFFQMAIMLSSVAALIKKHYLWFIGLGFGTFAIVYMVNGFFLFF